MFKSKTGMFSVLCGDLEVTLTSPKNATRWLCISSEGSDPWTIVPMSCTKHWVTTPISTPNQPKDTVRENFYVDDCLKFVTSIGEAISLSQELKSMLARGGFNLCNRIAVFKRIHLVDQFKNEKEGPWCTPGWKSPGCVWNIEDWLSYRVQHMDKQLTKQRLLSTLSSVYDPLGLASPFILKARKVFQDLCPVKRDWDELIGPDH